MKNRIFIPSLLIIFSMLLSSCATVGGIFKTGMGVGVFIAVIIIAVVLYFVSKIGNNK